MHGRIRERSKIYTWGDISISQENINKDILSNVLNCKKGQMDDFGKVRFLIRTMKCKPEKRCIRLLRSSSIKHRNLTKLNIAYVVLSGSTEA